VHTLRARLILSHILPLLIVVLLIGIALDYVLETQILLTNIAGELADDATLVATLASDNPQIWNDPVQAQAFLDPLAPNLVASAMLVDSKGHLMASTDPTDAERLGQVLDEIRSLDRVRAGEVEVYTAHSWYAQADVVDVWVPVWGHNHQVVGAVRLTNQQANTLEQILTLRHLILSVLVVGLLLGAGLAWALAINLGGSIRQVTRAVQQLSSGKRHDPLVEQGPDEIRRLLHAINTMEERLQALEENRRQLLTNLVHELGRPLGALLAATQALQGGADQDEALRQELFSGMVEEIGLLRRLLDDLSRLHDRVSGTLDLEHQPVVLTDWLPVVLGSWREAARAKGLNWQMALPDDLPVLEIDPNRMSQALGNLVGNAVKFTPSGGTVSVEAGIEDSEVWIKIGDTGPGISLNEQPHIFTPFYRGHSGRRFAQGMGLGLSIARDLVMAHGGRLEMSSTPGQGSRFTIWLPFTPGQPS
jgi:two-component system sensor histidine kinase BaeS